MNTIDIGNLEDVLLLDTIDEKYREEVFGYYKYENTYVPRVSIILKECINKQFLVDWAARVGYRKMNQIRDNATTIGTAVHEKIEHLLLTGEDSLESNVSFMLQEKVDNAYNNFKAWLRYINSMGVNIESVICTEKQITTPFYGGTIDAVLKINGRNYIVDFKTSKSISFEYIIQVSAYMWAVNNGYCPDLPHIDGIGIIRINKDGSNKFEDLFLNEYIPEQNLIIQDYIKGFGALLNSFYHTINMKEKFEQYKIDYSPSEIFKEV